MKLFIDIIGWVGSLMLIVAYWLLSNKKLDGQSLTYQLLNIVGSLLLMSNAFYYGAFPSTTINFIWIIIGGLALYKQRKHA